jgi:Na+-translocating ferredoxin:NAD+ oxidoreductase RnfD subunit
MAVEKETGQNRAPRLRDMIAVLVMLLPLYGLAWYSHSIRVLFFFLTALAAGAAVEAAFAWIRKRKMRVSLLVSTALYCLMLSPSMPLWLVALGMVFGIFFGKMVFGGEGHNVFNPALAGRCFIMLAYPLIVVDTSTARSSSGEELNEMMRMLISDVPEPGTRWVVPVIILGGVVLAILRAADWKIIVSVIIGGGTITGILLLTPFAGKEIITLLLVPGFAFGACFLATDPVTAPRCWQGKLLYGFLIGILAIAITLYATYGEGMMFAVLLGNLCTPTLDYIFDSPERA